MPQFYADCGRDSVTLNALEYDRVPTFLSELWSADAQLSAPLKGTDVSVTQMDVGGVRQTGEIRKLTSLLEVSQTLSTGLNFKVSLHRVLEILERSHDAVRGTVAVAGDDRRLQVVAVVASGRDRIADGAVPGGPLTRRVVESGRPIVVPRMSREPALADRRSDGEERSFVCVPLLLNRRAVGALCLELRFKSERDYDRTAKFFGVVGSMIAQAIKVQRLLEADRERLVQENVRLQGELRQRYDFSQILGTSGVMRQICEQIAQVARANTTVMIRGESGTGKELIAHAIHYNSLRASKPFVKVSCAALPDTLIESELFGYEKGAFTGAMARKKGRFEMADGGTLFLDEIADVNPTVQVKLLRVLQEREFERLGGTDQVNVNVRLIAATNKNLEESIAAGTFREDLMYRLNVFSIFVPPLRERKTDILLLADHFLERLAADHRKSTRRISTPAIDMLMAYHWPGNVRELQNVIERAVLVAEGEVLHAHHLPPTLQTADASGTTPVLSLTTAVDAYEKDLIQDALKMARGNRAKAARLLQATPRIVNYKIRKFRIDWRRFRA
jgi:Nif-specific regulatory protein